MIPVNQTRLFEHPIISCRKGGSFFNKRSRGLLQPERSFMLAVEDPNEPDNDLGKGSYNIPRVRQAFEFAYSQARRPGRACTCRSPGVNTPDQNCNP